MKTEIKSVIEIPAEIIAAAQVVSNWFKSNGHEQWELCDIQSRGKLRDRPAICPHCGDYTPGHATGAGDICTCSYLFYDEVWPGEQAIEELWIKTHGIDNEGRAWLTPRQKRQSHYTQNVWEKHDKIPVHEDGT